MFISKHSSSHNHDVKPSGKDSFLLPQAGHRFRTCIRYLSLVSICCGGNSSACISWLALRVVSYLELNFFSLWNFSGHIQGELATLVVPLHPLKSKKILFSSDLLGDRPELKLSCLLRAALLRDFYFAAVVKPMKRSKFSLVWTLHGADISKSYGNSLKRQKVLPHLFPWKRATYWRSFTPYSAFVSRNNSLSTIRYIGI